MIEFDPNRAFDVFVGNLPLLIAAAVGGYVTIKKLNKIHEQTDGMYTSGVKLAKEVGKQEGHAEADKAAMTASGKESGERASDEDPRN